MNDPSTDLPALLVAASPSMGCLFILLIAVLALIWALRHRPNRQARELEQQKITLAHYNEQLQQFIRHDRALNRCLEELLLSDDFDSAFRKVAAIIGTQLHATTVLIDRYQAGQPAYFEALACWTTAGAAPPTRYGKLLEENYPEIFEYLRQGGFIHLSSEFCTANDLLPWQQEMCGYLKESGMHEVICVPLQHNRKLWGYLGAEVQTPGQSFKSGGERMMTSAAHLIELLLQREESRRIQRREEEEKLMLLNVMPIPVVLMDSDYMVLQANSAALRMVGGDLSDYLGKTCRETICHRPVLDENCPLWLTLHTGEPQSMQRRINGRTYIVSTMPLPAGGELKRVLKVYIDITEITHTKELLQEAVARAEAAVQAKSQFLATMSHEIRTPLNAVVGFSELLQDTEMTESERKEYLRSINLAGNALLNLINDILDLSKLEAEPTSTSPALRPSKISELILEMQAIFQHRLADKNLAFEVIGAETPPTLMLDVQRLRQVLLNLIGNAVKFTRAGKITVEIGFTRAEDAAGQLKIIVSDTGIGVDESYKRRIFDPFVQEEAMRDSRNQCGTGLGLAIVKRLVEYMGGAITLDSVVNQGSSFTVTLPVQESEGDDALPASSPAAIAPSAHSSRVLIVDDVAMNLKVLGAMLKKIGCEFTATTSPEQALAFLANKHFDIVLTDLWMPEMNGADLAKKIKAIDPAITVYATTADVGSSESFDMHPFDGVVTKPLSFQKLQGIFAAGE